jgi:polar amino acid transport system substrate-binding protein
MRVLRSWLVLAIAVACIAVVAGCGSSSSNTTTTTTSTPSSGSSTAGIKADPAVEKQVPSSIKSKGTLNVAADASYAPDEFIGSDGHTVEGMDADLMTALADVMGLKANVTNQTFDSIIPGLAAGKYDVGASSFTDTKEREKTVDFADYFIAGESFFTKAQGGTTITGLDDSLCGKTVAVEKGTTEQDDATKQGAKCKAAGKPGVTVLAFPDQNGANLALSSGRAQLGFADSPVAAYQVKKSNGQFKLVGGSIENAPYGLAVPKNSGLLKPLLAALVSLKKSGKYESILSRWGIQAGAIKQFKANGAIS